MGRIYFYLKSFTYLNNPEIRLIIKGLEYTLKEVYFVVDEEGRKYVEKYTRNIVSLDEVDGWLVVEYEFIPEIKNKDIKIIGFYDDKGSFLKKYIRSVDHLKLNDFKNVVLLPNLKVILYKDGWWFYRDNKLIEYTDDLNTLFDLVPHPKGIIYGSHLLKIVKFLENLSYDYLIYPLPEVEVTTIKRDLIYYMIKEILKVPPELRICEILMYKDYTDVVLVPYNYDFFAIRVIVPTREIKRKMKEIKEETDKIKVADVKERIVVYDERDLDKIIKLKELLNPSKE